MVEGLVGAVGVQGEGGRVGWDREDARRKEEPDGDMQIQDAATSRIAASSDMLGRQDAQQEEGDGENGKKGEAHCRIFWSCAHVVIGVGVRYVGSERDWRPRWTDTTFDGGQSVLGSGIWSPNIFFVNRGKWTCARGGVRLIPFGPGLGGLAKEGTESFGRNLKHLQLPTW